MPCPFSTPLKALQSSVTSPTLGGWSSVFFLLEGAGVLEGGVHPPSPAPFLRKKTPEIITFSARSS
jgi:hypothetical protein